METNVNNVAAKTGLDPATILALIIAIGEIVVKFIGDCQQPPPTTSEILAESSTFRGRFVILKAMRQEGIPLLKRKAVHDALVAEVPAVTWEDARLYLGIP